MRVVEIAYNMNMSKNGIKAGFKVRYIWWNIFYSKRGKDV